MRWKVVDYIKGEPREVEMGTCDYCFGTAWESGDVMVLEDAHGKRVEVEMYMWDWDDVTNLYIENVVDFSAWLTTHDVDDRATMNVYTLANLIQDYNWEKYGDDE